MSSGYIEGSFCSLTSTVLEIWNSAIFSHFWPKSTLAAKTCCHNLFLKSILRKKVWQWQWQDIIATCSLPLPLHSMLLLNGYLPYVVKKIRSTLNWGGKGRFKCRWTWDKNFTVKNNVTYVFCDNSFGGQCRHLYSFNEHLERIM